MSRSPRLHVLAHYFPVAVAQLILDHSGFLSDCEKLYYVLKNGRVGGLRFRVCASRYYPYDRHSYAWLYLIPRDLHELHIDVVGYDLERVVRVVVELEEEPSEFTGRNVSLRFLADMIKTNRDDLLVSGFCQCEGSATHDLCALMDEWI